MPAARSKNTTLSETLKLVRQRRGLSASDVAQRMGMPLRTYHHFEGGYAQLDVERIRRFADATDSDPHAILTAVLLGAPAFAARTMDNKMMSVLIALLKNTTVAAGFSVFNLGSIRATMSEKGENQMVTLLWVMFIFVVMVLLLAWLQRVLENRWRVAR